MSGFCGRVFSHSLKADGSLSAEKRSSGSVVWPPFISVNLLRGEGEERFCEKEFHFQ